MVLVFLVQNCVSWLLKSTQALHVDLKQAIQIEAILVLKIGELCHLGTSMLRSGTVSYTKQLRWVRLHIQRITRLLPAAVAALPLPVSLCYCCWLAGPLQLQLQQQSEPIIAIIIRFDYLLFEHILYKVVFFSASLHYQQYYYKDGINIFFPHFIRCRGKTSGDRFMFFWICFDLLWIGSSFPLCVAFLPFPFRASLSCCAC